MSQHLGRLEIMAIEKAKLLELRLLAVTARLNGRRGLKLIQALIPIRPRLGISPPIQRNCYLMIFFFFFFLFATHSGHVLL